MKIDFKYIFWGALGLGFIYDVLNKCFMSIGIILGWLIGLYTMNQWEEQSK